MNFAKSAGLTFISNVLSFLLTIISAAIISRLLGTAGKGIVDVAANFSGFAVLFFGFGLASANVYYLGKRKESLAQIAGNNFFILGISFVLLIPLYLAQAHYQFRFLRGVSNFQFMLVLLAVPLIGFKSSMVNIFLGLQDVVNYNRINVIDKLTNLVVLSLLLGLASTPTSALAAALVAALGIAVWEIVLIQKQLRTMPWPNLSLLKEMLGYGLKAQVGNLLQKINYRIDVFIVNFFLPITQVGIYNVAVVLGETLWGVSSSIATVIFPVVAAARDNEQVYNFTNQVTRITFTLILLFSLGLALVSKPLIIMLFGRSFAEAVPALIWLLPGIGIFSISNILANYLAGVGQVEKNIYSSLASGVVTIILDFMLIPRLGINGASIATSLSYIAFTLSTLVFYRQATHSRWPDILILQQADLRLIRNAAVKYLKRP